jgi:hypothetical protein
MSRAGLTTSSPSTADKTEIAGVIIASPKNSAAPKAPTATRAALDANEPLSPTRLTKAIRAMIPPSPSLSARMTKATYFTDTTSVIDQKTIEITP